MQLIDQGTACDRPPLGLAGGWQTARTLARALGISKPAARRIAASNGWERRERGNRVEWYVGLRIADCGLGIGEGEGGLRIADCGLGKGEGETAPRVRFADLTADKRQRERVLERERAVLRVREMVGGGLGKEEALRRVGAGTEGTEGTKGISVSSLRRWEARYERWGLDGLVEQKQGRSGARGVAERIPAHVIEQARAASVEHGTLGKDGRQNIARAVRSVIYSHPDLPAEAREILHGGHASKAHVAPSIRRALRVSPQAIAAVQGSHAAAMASQFSVCSYEDVPAGRVVTADDMTANVYCWTEAPGALGYLVGRPQVLLMADVGALRWLTGRVIMRPSGGYTRDDVWGLIGDLFDEVGLYPEFLFEGGIWRSNIVLGERTGLTDEDRFGGLKQFGCVLRHSLLPRSKIIEGMFNQLQYASDAFPGYCGRREREDKPEIIGELLPQFRSGKLHPRGVLPHIAEYSEHLGRCTDSLNNERNDGKILRGMSPNEKWLSDNPKLPEFPESSKWMYRSCKSVVTVLRNGMAHITVGSGKFKEDYYYRGEVLDARAGQRVVVYWNDRRPEADAAVLSAGSRPEFLGMARYATPVPRFGATKEQMREEGRAKRESAQFARTQVVGMAPYFERQKAEGRRQNGGGTEGTEGTERGLRIADWGLGNGEGESGLARAGVELAGAVERAETVEREAAVARRAVTRVTVEDCDLAAATGGLRIADCGMGNGEGESGGEVTEEDIAALFPGPE